MKTIKDAVIELGGKWPKEFALGYMSYDGYRLYYDATGYQVCVKEQFESTAKRMGYINGYLWGKEYPTNGKRPDLPDDVVVQLTLNSFNINHEEAETANWSGSFKFKITDQRYKPVDEQEYEPVIITGADIVSGGGGGGFMPKAEPYFPPKKPESNWFERGELPPVGVECEFNNNGAWIKCKLVYKGKKRGMIEKMPSGDEQAITFERCVGKFRPIKSHREKVIEAAMKCCQAFPSTQLNFAEKLYEAGMLVLPQNSGDTE